MVALLAWASGPFAVRRPIRAALNMFLVEVGVPHSTQVLLSLRIVFPHPGQRFSDGCSTCTLVSDEAPLAVRLCACVKCVGANVFRVRFCVVDQNCLAIHMKSWDKCFVFCVRMEFSSYLRHTQILTSIGSFLRFKGNCRKVGNGMCRRREPGGMLRTEISR